MIHEYCFNYNATYREIVKLTIRLAGEIVETERIGYGYILSSCLPSYIYGDTFASAASNVWLQLMVVSIFKYFILDFVETDRIYYFAYQVASQ